jgi:hypothetical protein
MSEPSPEPVDEPAGRSRTAGGRVLIGALAASLVVVVVAVVGALLLTGDDDAAETVTIVVPAGTAEQQAAGETIELMPSNLDLRVGDTLRITNDDTVVQTVGPYTVAPGQTLRQTFTEPGEITGICSLSESGEVTITITA